jgi:hypothetical protein
MKLKAALLAAVFIVGLGTSLAFAKGPKRDETTGAWTATGTSSSELPKTKCAQVELKGNAAPGNVVFTVTKANKRGQSLVGTAVTLVVPENARIKAKACATGNVLTLRDLHVKAVPADS